MYVKVKSFFCCIKIRLEGHQIDLLKINPKTILLLKNINSSLSTSAQNENHLTHVFQTL